MRSLGALSGSVERGGQRLERLNDALLAVQADAAGKLDVLGLDSTDVVRGRKSLSGFVTTLQRELELPVSSSELQPLINRLKRSSQAVQDWQEDLTQTRRELGESRPLSPSATATLSKVIHLLDEEFAEDLQRLRTR